MEQRSGEILPPAIDLTYATAVWQAALDRLKGGQDRLGIVDDDLFDAVQRTVRELRQQRDELHTELAATKLPKKRRLEEANAKVDANMNVFSRLRSAQENRSVPQLREFLQAAIDSVVLTVDKLVQHKRSHYVLRGGGIYLHSPDAWLCNTPGHAPTFRRSRTELN